MIIIIINVFIIKITHYFTRFCSEYIFRISYIIISHVNFVVNENELA
jgi:hypothetical protein